MTTTKSTKAQYLAARAAKESERIAGQIQAIETMRDETAFRPAALETFRSLTAASKHLREAMQSLEAIADARL